MPGRIKNENGTRKADAGRTTKREMQKTWSRLAHARTIRKATNALLAMWNHKASIMNYREMKSELMMGWDRYDRWGSAMGMFFDVAEELHRRNEDIPSEWQFRPSPLIEVLGDGEPDTYEAEILRDADADDITRLGKVLHRYTGMLDRAGHSY